nr:CD1871A family CXXC motif-containing protein [uncultured Oscillibacter sp.]
MNFWKSSSRCAWIGGVLTGVLFLSAGAFQGQFSTIWKKAVMICLECIGIG